MTAIKLLIADVDGGTLVTRDRMLTARTCAAVECLRVAGVQFAITSSRPPRGLASLTGPLALTTPVAAFNGGMLVQPDLVTLIEERTLPLAVSVEVVEFLRRAGLDVWVYRGADWFIASGSPAHVAEEQRRVQFAPTVVADPLSILDGAVKLVGVSDDLPLMERCEAALREQIGAHASAARSEPYLLDITHPDANKGMAVRQLAHLLQVPLEQVATIGDRPNDVAMFGVAGTSIAMGHAGPEVQRCARHVTTANDDEGFANAVAWFVLGTPPTAQETLGLPPRTRACLFDLDGVLTQTAKLHAAAWKQMFDEYLFARSQSTHEPFVPFDIVQDYDRYVDGKLRADGARSFLASRGIHLPEQEVQSLANRKDGILLDRLRHEHVATYEGSVRYVHAARAAGLRTAVVSSSRNCSEVLASAGIADLFDARIDGVVAAKTHLAGKPAPDTFLAAARAVGVEPAQAVVFEDAIAGVEAGRAGHFGYVVGVDRVGQAAELRRHGADIVVSDLAALLNPRPQRGGPRPPGAP